MRANAVAVKAVAVKAVASVKAVVASVDIKSRLSLSARSPPIKNTLLQYFE
jgi:hypothetical protein